MPSQISIRAYNPEQARGIVLFTDPEVNKDKGTTLEVSVGELKGVPVIIIDGRRFRISSSAYKMLSDYINNGDSREMAQYLNRFNGIEVDINGNPKRRRDGRVLTFVDFKDRLSQSPKLMSYSVGALPYKDPLLKVFALDVQPLSEVPRIVKTSKNGRSSEHYLIGVHRVLEENEFGAKYNEAYLIFASPEGKLLSVKLDYDEYKKFELHLKKPLENATLKDVSAALVRTVGVRAGWEQRAKEVHYSRMPQKLRTAIRNLKVLVEAERSSWLRKRKGGSLETSKS